MTDLEPKEADEKCNARKTDGSGYCSHRAGWGTDHVGHGRCKYHGGSTPDQEQNVINELSDAAEHASVAYRLRLKHVREKVEQGDVEDIEWGELDRLARTAFDRTGHGPSDKRELEHSGDAGIVIHTQADDGDD